MPGRCSTNLKRQLKAEGALLDGALRPPVRPTVIATTGPLMEHLDLLTLAGMEYGQDRWTTDTEFFSPHFSRGTIGLLRGNAGASGVAIEFDVPDRFPLRRQFNGIMVPDVPAKSLDLLEAHVREHAGMRAADSEMLLSG